MVTHRCTTIVRDEKVLLIVATTEELKGTRVRVVAHGLEHHVVTFCDCKIAYIFHGLDEGQRASVGSLGLLLEMHSESRLMIDIVSAPEVHGNAPEDGELGEAAPDVRHIPEEL